MGKGLQASKLIPAHPCSNFEQLHCRRMGGKGLGFSEQGRRGNLQRATTASSQQMTRIGPQNRGMAQQQHRCHMRAPQQPTAWAFMKAAAAGPASCAVAKGAAQPSIQQQPLSAGMLTRPQRRRSSPGVEGKVHNCLEGCSGHGNAYNAGQSLAVHLERCSRRAPYHWRPHQGSGQ
jgi:hypothetical protein